jgi:hypothetical protein
MLTTQTYEHKASRHALCFPKSRPRPSRPCPPGSPAASPGEQSPFAHAQVAHLPRPAPSSPVAPNAPGLPSWERFLLRLAGKLDLPPPANLHWQRQGAAGPRRPGHNPQQLGRGDGRRSDPDQHLAWAGPRRVHEAERLEAAAGVQSDGFHGAPRGPKGGRWPRREPAGSRQARADHFFFAFSGIVTSLASRGWRITARSG